MSADSGLPTYRGVGGLYNRGETEEGFAIEEMLSGPMFRQKPEWTWKYLREVEQACRGATFNRGHAVLAEMERHFERVWTLTQNVDGFHHRAGSRNVIAIHGDLGRSAARAAITARRWRTTPPSATCRAARLLGGVAARRGAVRRDAARGRHPRIAAPVAPRAST